MLLKIIQFPISLETDSVPSKDSFWKLILLPKVLLLCLTVFSLSACLGFLDPTMSLFILKKVSPVNTQGSLAK